MVNRIALIAFQLIPLDRSHAVLFALKSAANNLLGATHHAIGVFCHRRLRNFLGINSRTNAAHKHRRNQNLMHLGNPFLKNQNDFELIRTECEDQLDGGSSDIERDCQAFSRTKGTRTVPHRRWK